MIAAGAPLRPETAARFRRRFDRGLHVFYGASECGGIAYDRSGAAGERGTVGEPVRGVRVAIEAPDGSPAGAGGRVVVRTPAAGGGYLPEPGPDLADGRYVTRDLGRFEGSEIRLLGRLDDLINVRGRKVRPAEIEGVIAACARVDDVVVHAVDDARRGDQSIRAVVASARGGLDPETVLAWCRERLSAHKVPRRVVLVRALPRTARGKVDRIAAERLGAAEEAADA